MLSQSQRTFVQAAAKAPGEPRPEASIFCCERMQHENLLRRREIVAASQRRMRSFKHYAAILKS